MVVDIKMIGIETVYLKKIGREMVDIKIVGRAMIYIYGDDRKRDGRYKDCSKRNS